MSYYNSDSDSEEDFNRLTDEQQKNKIRERKNRKRRIKDEEKMIECALNSIRIILNRYKDIDDPVIRNSLLVDKFILMIDIFTGMTEVFTKQYSLELREKLQGVTKEVHEELKELSKWIQMPTYSPDHPFGNTLMKEAEKNFNSHSDEVDVKKL